MRNFRRIATGLLVLALVDCAMAQPATTAPSVNTAAFVLPDNAWTKLGEVPPDPLGRELEPGRGAYCVYDPVSGKFIRYGGYTPTDDNSLWTYDLAGRKWDNPIRVSYDWPPPADRPGAGAWWSMAYDAKRKVVWLHGGSGLAERTHGELFNDIWQYDPATGKFKAAGGKSYPRYGAPIVYDAKNDLIVRAPAYSGEWSAMHNRDKTWVFDPNKNAWDGRDTKVMPAYSGTAGFIYEPNVGKCVYLARDRAGSPIVAWAYDAAANAWEKLATPEDQPAPASRVCGGACYDPNNKVILIAGGVGGPKDGYGYLYRGGGINLDDTWALDVAKARWTKLEVGTLVRPKLPDERGERFVMPIAMEYDAKLAVAVISAPTFGVWALRYRPAGEDRAGGPAGEGRAGGPAGSLPAGSSLKLAALPAFDPPKPPAEGVYKQAPPNKKLVDLPAGVWTKLDGGACLGGGEVPFIYDETTGFALKYGGCNNNGTTFASGYGNDLSAYDPATERWIAIRWVDPAGPPRPANGCTRYYAYDPVRKVAWFMAGTAGNNLAYSSLGKGNMWFYDSKADRFDQAQAKMVKFGTGIVSGYDRTTNQIILSPKEAWAGGNVCLFDPATLAWKDTGVPCRPDAYTYGCCVETLKGLVVIDASAKDADPKTMLFLPGENAWKDLAPKGDALPRAGRPALAYDPDSDVVLDVSGGKTLAYSVKDNKWTDQPGQTPPVAEHLVYDRRHKVFIGTAVGQPVFAYRLAK